MGVFRVHESTFSFRLWVFSFTPSVAAESFHFTINIDVHILTTFKYILWCYCGLTRICSCYTGCLFKIRNKSWHSYLFTCILVYWKLPILIPHLNIFTDTTLHECFCRWSYLHQEYMFERQPTVKFGLKGVWLASIFYTLLTRVATRLLWFSFANCLMNILAANGMLL